MADVRNECFPCGVNADSGALKTFLFVPERQKLTTMTADVLFRGDAVVAWNEGGGSRVALVCLG